MLYAYKAVGADGRLCVGRMVASNPHDLEMRLQRLALELIRAAPVRRNTLFGPRRLPRRELINFCFHLEQLSSAGVPLLEGLADLRDSTELPPLRDIVASLIDGIEGGQTLSQAMDSQPQTFRPVFISLIHAGESTGRLPEVLASLTESLKWEDELAAHTRKLLLYPAVVGAVVLAASIFLMLYLVPQLKLFVKTMGQALPLHSRALFFLSDLLVDYWFLLLAQPVVAFGVAVLLRRANPLAALWLDGFKLRLPVVGSLLKKIALARFANTFALLYASGIAVLEAIRLTQPVVGNRLIRQALERVEQAIGEGQNLAGAVRDAGLFPPLVVRMLRIGENTGELDRSLRNVGYFYHRDVKEAVGRAQAMLEPLLTLLTGLLLGWVMLSVIGPIYDVISKIKP